MAVPRMKRAVLFLITAYVSVPVILYLFPWILGHAIYAHLLRIPFFVDLGRPEQLLNHTCNFYLTTEEGVSVGVWHTLPASQWEQAAGRGPEWYQETLGDGRPVIIYLHGNLGTRWDDAAGYHVLSLDYRGFGDSSGEPSEAGLTADALYLHQWVKTHSRGSRVCLWGHSLGSGVATNTALKVQEQGEIKPLNLKTLMSPLLVLHAEDDDIVPYHMGLKLYEISLQAQRERNTEVQVQMISYSANLGYSHNNIYLDPNLPKVVG
uniref:AB hydrolase-1 domain-containing protein n=1 Tax=Myripristis murdjan TaxID=586833 RepID=A0A668A1B3_9TELE